MQELSIFRKNSNFPDRFNNYYGVAAILTTTTTTTTYDLVTQAQKHTKDKFSGEHQTKKNVFDIFEK